MSVLSAGYDVVVSRVPALLGLLAIVLVVGFASQSASASSTRSVHDATVRHAAEVSEGDRVFGEGVGEDYATEALRVTGSAHAGASVGLATHLLGACAAILAAVLVLMFATRASLVGKLVGMRPALRLAWRAPHPASARGAPDHQELRVQLC